MKKKKGFTLVELLVVIAIIALLMGILMPALARVRQIAYRLYCGTNLSGLGKAMLIYCNDYDDEMPRAGGPSTMWGNTANFRAPTRDLAFGLSGGRPGAASITASFYLLVKYAEVTPKSFLCKGDSGVTEFKPSDYGVGSMDLIDLWDFGSGPQQNHCSYAYHLPYGLFALTSSTEPGMAVAADPNPWQQSANTNPRDAADWGAFRPLGSREEIKKGNAIPHQEDGQNVLFMDAHVKFEKNSACGINDDNIFTTWNMTDSTRADRSKGIKPALVSSTASGPGQQPQHRLDSFVVTDNLAVGGR